MGKTLEGKIAVVTGAGRGVGRAVAELMAGECAKVVVNDLGGTGVGTGSSTEPADEVVAQIKKNGGVAVANYDTVATMEGGERIVRAAIDNFGRIDILVNNAGVWWFKLFDEITEKDWDTMFQVHVKGHFTCCKAAVPYMIKQRYGRIINTASGAATGAFPGMLHYGAAKGAIVSFTKGLATELREHGITVNTVWPYAVTRLTLAIPEGEPLRDLLATMPGPEATAPIHAFLASDAAANVTGVTLACMGHGLIQRIGDLAPTQGVFKDGVWEPAELTEVALKTLVADLAAAPPAKA